MRVQPKESKIEVDLSIDENSENYDREVPEHLRIKKQVYVYALRFFGLFYSVSTLLTSF